MRLAILYGNETWCLKEKEMVTKRRIEGPMIRAMCSIQLMEGRSSQELMNFLGLEIRPSESSAIV